jgi:transposase-like protein
VSGRVEFHGRREVLGIEVVTAEDGAGWLAFLRSLSARGLKGGAAARIVEPGGVNQVAPC